jgi:hypothetical protein
LAAVLLARPVLEGIIEGRITLVFRRWLRPGVRAGGTLKTALGVLAIEDVQRVTESQIQDEDAHAAGHRDRCSLLGELSRRDGDLYRVRVRFAGADPRVALRERAELGAEELAALQQSLHRLDAGSRAGPWALAVLQLIAARPAVLAARLAQQLEQPTELFKRNVRKLKELGLTESLDVGYRLSPRGQRLLEVLGAAPRRDAASRGPG